MEENEGNLSIHHVGQISLALGVSYGFSLFIYQYAMDFRQSLQNNADLTRFMSSLPPPPQMMISNNIPNLLNNNKKSRSTERTFVYFFFLDLDLDFFLPEEGSATGSST